MTNQEAIDYLIDPIGKREQHDEAIALAISALQEQEAKHSEDTISRQAAINAICSECQGRCIPCEHYPCGEIKALNNLPSVEPEIIR